MPENIEGHGVANGMSHIGDARVASDARAFIDHPIEEPNMYISLYISLYI